MSCMHASVTGACAVRAVAGPRRGTRVIILRRQTSPWRGTRVIILRRHTKAPGSIHPERVHTVNIAPSAADGVHGQRGSYSSLEVKDAATLVPPELIVE